MLPSLKPGLRAEEMATNKTAELPGESGEPHLPNLSVAAAGSC